MPRSKDYWIKTIQHSPGTWDMGQRIMTGSNTPWAQGPANFHWFVVDVQSVLNYLHGYPHRPSLKYSISASPNSHFLNFRIAQVSTSQFLHRPSLNFHIAQSFNNVNISSFFKKSPKSIILKAILPATIQMSLQRRSAEAAVAHQFELQLWCAKESYHV